MSDTAAVGGVDRGVPGLEFGVDVAGVAMAGVVEAEVMIGSAVGGRAARGPGLRTGRSEEEQSRSEETIGVIYGCLACWKQACMHIQRTEAYQIVDLGSVRSRGAPDLFGNLNL